MAKAKFTVRRYDGDDQYSWAVFRSQDVRGLDRIIFWGQAQPIVCGLSRDQALYHKRGLEKK